MLNETERKHPAPEVTQFNAVEQFKYPGIQILSRLNHVTKANYESLMTDVNESLQNQRSLPMSMIGRINILIRVMSYQNDLFQNIPLSPPSDLFSRIKKNVCGIYGTIGGLDYIYHLIVGV